VLDASGVRLASAFSDERGRFDIAISNAMDCRVEASLTGFASASIGCQPAPLLITLTVAGVQETVVVSATRTEAPVGQVGASVTTFTAEDLARRRAPLVADVLRASPGAMVVRSGGVGSVTSLFVRGGESNHNKVLIDGIPVNDPGGTFYFDNLTTDNLERIEVVRGAQSALFGSDAMASVVQLFTKRADPTGKPETAFALEGGSYGTVRESASVLGRTRRFDYSLAAARLDTNNRVPNSEFDNTSFSANVGATIASAIVRFIGRGELGRNGAPGQTAFGRPDLDAFARRRNGVGGVVLDQQLTRAIRQRVSYSLAVSNQQSTDLLTDPPYIATFQNRVAAFESLDFNYDSRTNLRRHHASYQADVRLANDSTRGNQVTTVLGDWDGERATLEDRVAQTRIQASRDNFGVSVQHQALWRRVAVIGGGRFEHNESFGNAVVPRGSVLFVAHDGGGAIGATRIHAAAGKGIKEPTVLQSFSPSPFFLGNPNLEPERSRGVEVGIDQRLASDRAKLALTWFDNRYDNLISTRTTNPRTFEAQYFNIGLTTARGAEFTVDISVNSSMHARGGYTWLDSEIVESTAPSSVIFQPGQALFRRPRHSGFAEMGWTHNRVTADLLGVFIGRFVDSDFSSLQPPLVVNPGFKTWDARLSYKATSQLACLVAIDNIGDADYMEPLGYQALRRAIRVGLRVGF
jgi:outer membrane cobalamin receptor